MARVELVGLNPEGMTLPQPEPGDSYAIYVLSGFSESGIHAFLRLVAALGPTMAGSRLSLQDIERVARVAGVVAAALEDRRQTPGELAAAVLESL